MTADAAAAPSSPAAKAWLRRVVLAGLAGGAVDFVYASALAVLRGRPVISPWLSVASGWIGKAAKDAGLAGAALGVATHFAIAIVMALAYALAAARLPALYRRPLACGLAYGCVLYGVMYGIVLPVRFGRPYHWGGVLSAADIASHLGVGLLIALVLSRGRPRFER